MKNEELEKIGASRGNVPDPVDAVFVIGTGSKNDNEELKYALRNLERNCPFIRDVYISGECPQWVNRDAVKHLKWSDRFTHAKDANIIDKLRHACETDGVAKNVLFCSDDQFQTRVCQWEDFLPRWLRQYKENDSWYEDRKRIWHSRLRRTLERDRLRRLESGLDPSHVFYYQPHIWMPIDRDTFVEYAKWSDYEHRDDTIIASGYFNFADVDGQQNFDHIFISSSQTWPVKETHVAYSDPSFSAAMYYLHKTFDRPSRYEEDGKRSVTVPVSRTSEASFLELPQPSSATDADILESFKRKVLGVSAWAPLLAEIEDAEALRKGNVVGWKRVWNNIMSRWAHDTDRGRHHVPVTSEKSEDVKSILSRNQHLLPKRTTAVRTPARTDGSVQEPEKKTCTKCEERKKKMLEAAAKEDRKTADEARHALTGVTPEHRRSLTSTKPAQSPDVSWACQECAVEHLSVAIAHMNANLGRPGPVDIEMAKGELSVAAQHLLALRRTEAYNSCINVLESTYSESSLLSVSSLRDILRRVLDKGV